MNKISFFLILLFIPILGFTQQIPLNTQYTYDLYQINPAAAGSTDGMPLSLSVRKLWLGIDGSPSIQTLSGHIQVVDRMGVGAKIYNFSEGPLRNTGFEGTYAYHLPLGEGSTKLAFGLTASFFQYSLDKTKLDVQDPNDPALQGDSKKMVPDATFGTLIYNEKYFAGITIQQLFQGKINLGTQGIADQKRVRHYFVHWGYNFDINEDIRLQPSVLFKFIEAGVIQADINTRMTYRKMINFGLSYRTGDALSIQLGYQNDNLLFGYAYDLALSDIRTQTSGSHEIVFIYKLPNFIKK
ncbi:MAG: type IX secretion system membrane protein PorP/SprF [Chlorobi bacterium]|nr:type IX secretion system membrane protein PorP/SprF [Chlorobiota bacterium]